MWIIEWYSAAHVGDWRKMFEFNDEAEAQRKYAFMVQAICDGAGIRLLRPDESIESQVTL